MRRLEVRDRKAMTGAAMVSAELWNINRDRERHPEPFTASDFLPETAADRRRRAQKALDAEKPPSDEDFEAYKAALFASMSVK